MNDKDEIRRNHFLQDLQNFLGLTQPLPPPPHYKPGNKLTKEQQEERNARKIDICHVKYQHQRQKLAFIGANVQQWILDYFLDSPDVHISNPEHFRALVSTYGQDPCLNPTSTTSTGDNQTKT